VAGRALTPAYGAWRQLHHKPKTPVGNPKPAGDRERKRGGCGGCLARIAAFLLLAGLLYGAWSIFDASSNRGAGAPGFVQSLIGSHGPRIGLVAGHAGSDSGAVCPDGLREADVNQRVAQETRQRLEKAGYQVDLMSEFAAQLSGYAASAFVSIHSDSCVSLSGFKVARQPESQVPAQADQLVQCLYREYGLSTGLQPNPNTITRDMTEYHAFREISPDTPGAIIEVGFLGGDRSILTEHPDWVAEGIAQGILCYMSWLHPTPTPSPQP
jgi:N-acetylmuramoyl-L-alanine amidase